jgi:hypothetical protein
MLLVSLLVVSYDVANSVKFPSSLNGEGHPSFDAFQTVEFVHLFDSALSWHSLEKLKIQLCFKILNGRYIKNKLIRKEEIRATKEIM